MATAFASLQARANLAIMERLSDTVATLDGVEVSGLFDDEYLLDDIAGGMAGSGPAFTLASSAVPPAVTGLALVVKGVTYKVVEPKPDGTGITVLRLRKV